MKQEVLAEQLVDWRRDFHQYPETGFLEIRTASKVAGVLEKLGYELSLGKEVMSEADCMGKPEEQETKQHVKWALENGADKKYVEYFAEGYTGIVATLETAQPGPTIAYRFDMDALPIHESEEADHVPNQLEFRSGVANTMHACGHDSHTAIGLGLATQIAENQDKLRGTIKLIFQPAEEGTRGAKSMAEAGVVDQVDYFIASHIGTGVPHRHFVAANNGFLATSKLNITFQGVASHAGAEPQEGKNALLAAASAALNMHAIARHSNGSSRVNVGELHAGTGRNIIPDQAVLIAETRGETSEINQYVKEQVQSIVDGAAKMYQLDYQLEVAGEALNCDCSLDLAEILKQCATSHPEMDQALLESNDSAGSEDATYFMERVQRNGGLATYCIFGTELAAGHHNEKFDIHEDTLLPAVEILYQAVEKLGAKER
ncbi:amidohydrolase [Oceanobacillus timonensis]|uniref:amidohydrolase n=1 Tax=Oceanobacillus timonensis TaxID=1926285 RepID=UPI0009BC28C9|nr:amidohydrolase [Oceanobacillus timonensis]